MGLVYKRVYLNGLADGCWVPACQQEGGGFGADLPAPRLLLVTNTGCWFLWGAARGGLLQPDFGLRQGCAGVTGDRSAMRKVMLAVAGQGG